MKSIGISGRIIPEHTTTEEILRVVVWRQTAHRSLAAAMRYNRELEVTPFEETLRTNSVCDPKNALDSIPNWNILERLHQENEDIALFT